MGHIIAGEHTAATVMSPAASTTPGIRDCLSIALDNHAAMIAHGNAATVMQRNTAFTCATRAYMELCIAHTEAYAKYFAQKCHKHIAATVMNLAASST